VSERTLFADKAKIQVKAGNGGNGAVSFRREKFVPRGGPDGGNGAPGGHVLLVADPHLSSLVDFLSHVHWLAGNGGHGGGANRTGKKGASLVIRVPVGTVVREAESGQALADLDEAQASFRAARGGKGGRGNASFATSVSQAPRFAEKGDPGEERWLVLELKLLADVGLIGPPNAGKSTLLAALTAAQPKIADYPFTTLDPNLGVARWDDQAPFVIADLPGLVEGAHLGAGRGIEFLRHVERTRMLAHVLDAAGEDPLAAFAVVNEELGRYQERLNQVPQLVVLNKLDLPQAREQEPALRQALEGRGYPAFAVSALTRAGLEPLLEALSAGVQQERAARPKVSTEIAPPQRVEPLRVQKVGEGTYRVFGRGVERLVGRTDLSSDQAIARLQRSFERMGVTGRLRQLGAQAGDKVLIGPHEFDYLE